MIEMKVELSCTQAGFERVRGTVVRVEPPFSIVVVLDDGEEYLFQLGVDGKWYEINDSQTGWEMKRSMK